MQTYKMMNRVHHTHNTKESKMKKIVLNISDLDYERFRFEAIHEKKSVQDVLKERVFSKPFDEEVEEAFDAWMTENLNEILKD
jgi:sulfatase maturation enzyme AslB (radical SAM superfamily)